MKVPWPARRRLSFGAKNSSVAHSTAPPRRSAARSISCSKSATDCPFSQHCSARWRPQKLSLLVDFLASQESHLHHALKRMSQIRGDWMPMVDHLCLECKSLIRVPDHQI